MIEPKENTQNIPQESHSYRLKLDENENVYGTPSYIVSTIKNMDFEELAQFPNNRDFINKLSCEYAIDSDSIIPLNESEEGLSAIIDLYLNANDEIILLHDIKPETKNKIHLKHATICQTEFEKIEQTISDKTKIIYLSTPNFETGGMIRASLIGFLAKKYPDILFLVDCSYINYANDVAFKDYLDLVDGYKNIIVMKSFSYDFALSGLKLSFIYSKKEIADILRKIIPSDNINLIALKCGCSALNNAEHFEEIKEKNSNARKALYKGLIEKGFKPYESEANYILCDFCDYTDFYYQKFKNNGVKVKKYEKSSPYSNCLRLTVAKTGGVKYILKLLDKKDLIIFDIDGVIFDVRNSYNKTIIQTVKHFSNLEITQAEIAKIKNLGGFNCDYNTVRYFLENHGFSVDIKDIAQVFQDMFYNPAIEGKEFLIDGEKLIISKNILEKLNEKYDLVIFTGRYRFEAEYSLKKFEIDKYFSYLVTGDDLAVDELKPNSKGVLNILKHCPHKSVKYIGDSVDDIIAGNKANVETIGIIAPGADEGAMRNNFKHLCANAILKNVNDIFDYLEINEQN